MVEEHGMPGAPNGAALVLGQSSVVPHCTLGTPQPPEPTGGLWRNTKRPMTREEEEVYHRLLPMMSRAGLRVDFAACAALAREIQSSGHRARHVRSMARAMKINPLWLPHRRTKD